MSNILDWKFFALACIVTAVIGAAASGFLTWHYLEMSYTAKVDKQAKEASNQLLQATNRATKAERDLTAKSAELESASLAHAKEMKSEKELNARLAAELGGLRDPGRRPGCGNANAANASSAGDDKDSATGSRLSAEASQFLLDFAEAADNAASYAQTCSAWRQSVETWAKGLQQGSP